MTPYAVTGATGHLGRLAIESLIEHGAAPSDIVAIARTPARLADLAARGIDVRAADYAQPDTLPGALAGVERLLLISGSELGQRVAQHGNVIDAAKAAGVTRIAYTSILRADTSPSVLAPEHRATELLLAASGVEHIVLRNGWYIENYTDQLPQYLAQGEIVAAAGDGRVSGATRADYAAAAAAVLTGDGHGSAVYELGGTPFTLGELAAEVTGVTGTNVDYRNVTVAELVAILEAAGLDRPTAELFAAADEGVARGDVYTDSDDLARLIGRPSTPFADAIRAAIRPLVMPNRKGVVIPKAVRFDEYGGVDVLKVIDVPQPVPDEGQVLVRVKAAGINPAEAKIREGLLHAEFPVTFPSGEGSDFAGIVVATGPGVTGFSVGDEVIGFTENRASHATYVLAEAENLTPRPAGVSWAAAGSLFAVGTAAYAAVRAVALTEGDTVVVSGAAGGVGSIAVQLAKRAGATVIGLASETNHEWLRSHGVIPVTYGDGVADRIRQAAGRVDGFVDTFGGDYVQIALDLGIEPSRIDTIANFEAIEKDGVKGDGTGAGANAGVLAVLASLLAAGELEIPIAGAYPLDLVRDAYGRLGQGHLRGKIVLVP